MRFRSKPAKSGAAIALGWLGVAFGLTELLATRRGARALGLERQEGLVRLFGMRELANGIALLAARRAGPWLWLRVAGDLLDLGVLVWALSPRNPKCDKAAMVLASVLGVTMLDVAAGTKHDRRSARAR
jgi:hypothetical protein